jgi:hypothetical protein
MARLLCYIHPHVSRYAQVDEPCRQTIIWRNRLELFLNVTLTGFSRPDLALCLLVDDRADMLALQGGQDMFRVMQCIDDLQFFEALGPLEHRENRPLYDQVVQIQFQQRLGGNTIDKFRGASA